jgi:hypothetical protein
MRSLPLFLLVAAAVVVAMAASVLSRRLWPFRRSVSMLLLAQLVLGAAALVLSIASDKTGQTLAIACLAGAGLCLCGRVIGERRTWSARWHSWRARPRGRQLTSQVHVWVDALGAGLIAATFPWADGRQMAMTIAAFLFTGVISGSVQSIRVSNRKHEL